MGLCGLAFRDHAACTRVVCHRADSAGPVAGDEHGRHGDQRGVQHRRRRHASPDAQRQRHGHEAAGPLGGAAAGHPGHDRGVPGLQRAVPVPVGRPAVLGCRLPGVLRLVQPQA
ncbi:hypothetical protein G6F22_020950 [Rhizopus arrhizus]|nr:hypothetical protein G6F22_020950 [Rhizopus arrhizus]